jgi:hypothetical protein
MPRQVCKTRIYDINILQTVMLLLLQNRRSNQLYFTCCRLCLPVVVQAAVLSCFDSPVDVKGCSGECRRLCIRQMYFA